MVNCVTEREFLSAGTRERFGDFACVFSQSAFRVVPDQLIKSASRVSSPVHPVKTPAVVKQDDVKKFGIGVSMSLLPFASVAGFILLAIEPTLAMMVLLTVLRRALGFSFSKPTTDMLYSVVTPEEKYKTKNFIDTAVYRAGDLLGTWTIRAFILVGMSVPVIAAILLPFAAGWGAIAIWLGRDYRRQAKQARMDGII